MKITEKVLIDNFTGVAECGHMISDVEGKRIFWDWMRGSEGEHAKDPWDATHVRYFYHDGGANLFPKYLHCDSFKENMAVADKIWETQENAMKEYLPNAE